MFELNLAFNVFMKLKGSTQNSESEYYDSV